MKKSVFVVIAALLLAPGLAGAQNATTQSSSSTTTKDGKTTTTTTRVEESQPSTRFVRTLTNVQIELTVTDQSGSGTPEKKTVSMIASSGSWGKIRSASNVIQIGEAPYPVDLNVDARPFVSVDGPIQLELTLNYYPMRGPTETREAKRPAAINQSQTVVLQSGKPMLVSQASDPTSDRKVTVEVKATVLK